MYGFPTQTVQDTVDALEYVRQLFAAGCIQSGFFHRFACTVHSPVGRDPAAYGVTLQPLPPVTFREERHRLHRPDRRRPRRARRRAEEGALQLHARHRARGRRAQLVRRAGAQGAGGAPLHRARAGPTRLIRSCVRSTRSGVRWVRLAERVSVQCCPLDGRVMLCMRGLARGGDRAGLAARRPISVLAKPARPPPCRHVGMRAFDRRAVVAAGGGACRSSTDIVRRADRQAPLPAVRGERSRHRSNPPKYSGQRTVGIAATARSTPFFQTIERKSL